MDILVCIKQVPGTSQVEVDPVTGTLRREGVEGKMNPYDLYGLELALKLAQQYQGRVRALTMGPPQATAVVEEAVYMGAEGGFVVTDRAFAGADVLATSYTLSQAIRRLGSFDLIICGKQTTDGDTAQVGAELSEFLDLPFISNVLEVEDIREGRIFVLSDQDSSLVRASLPLPCLLSVDGGINTPRLPSYKRRRAMPGLETPLLSLADLQDGEAAHYGADGSPTRVERIFPPDKNVERVMVRGDAAQLTQSLLQTLEERKFI